VNTADNRYSEEDLPDDNGTMPENVDMLRAAVVGRRIVKAERRDHEDPMWAMVGISKKHTAFFITLDDGTEVRMRDTADCCAYTMLDDFLLHPERVDHMILGVGTTEGFERWHIYADLGDVLELIVGWSAGNPFYYGYGFDIDVIRPDIEARRG
jgi:hypothetical protein